MSFWSADSPLGMVQPLGRAGRSQAGQEWSGGGENEAACRFGTRFSPGAGALCDHGMHNAGRCQCKDPGVFTSLAPGSQMRDGPYPLRAGPVLTATTVIIPVLEGFPGSRY